jgi:CP family cyanate transporter-like MFS transporter
MMRALFGMGAVLPDDGSRTASQVLKLLALLWCAGVALRVPILGVPPMLPHIRESLRMSETEVGLLIGLPLAMFAIAAIPGSLIVSRLGATRTMLAGLAVTALAAASRSLAPDVILLYAATMAMGFGMAIAQPALPVLVREWLPRRMSIATAAFTNGSLIGAVAASFLTIPFILPWVGGSWRIALAVWAGPIVAAVAVIAVFAPQPQVSPAGVLKARRWWPDWNSPLIWMLGLAFGVNNCIYFGINAFVPEYLHHFGRGDLVTAALTALNLAQLTASTMLLFMAERVQRRAWTYTLGGPAAFAGLIGVVLSDGYWSVAFVAFTGFATAINFIVMLSLPAVLSAPHEAHRTAGGMFTIGYTMSVIGPVVSGALWDLTGLAWMAFVPAMICALSLALLGPVLVRFPVPEEAAE